MFPSSSSSPHPSPSSLLLSPPPPPAAPPTTPFPPSPSTLLPSPPSLAAIPPQPRPRLKRPLTSAPTELEAITEATSPDGTTAGGADEQWVEGLKLGLEREVQGGGMRKRRKREPDHEAFAQLSLVNGLSPVNPSLSLPTAPPPHQQTGFHLVPPLPSSAPPTTPPLQQGPSHLASSFPSINTNLEPSPSPQSLGFAPPTSPSADSFGLGLQLEDVGMSLEQPMDQTMEDVDEEMRPARGSYDLTPHRIYIASLSDDDDDEDPLPPPPAPASSPTSSSQGLELHPTLLAQRSPFPPSPLPSSLLPPSQSQAGAGSLILYRPLLFPSTPTSPPSAAEQEKERRRAKKVEEFDEFRREQEREERRSEGGGLGEVQRGVEEMELDG